jgi:isopenicillin N synthase-like dioxygenase
VGSLREQADAFFGLPMADKRQCRPPRPDINRGYFAMGDETASYSIGVDSPGDLFEAFNIGRQLVEGQEIEPALSGLFAPDIWPDTVPSLRGVLLAYFEAVSGLAQRLLGVFAEALGLSEAWFADKVNQAPDTLRLLHYDRHPGQRPAGPDQMGMGAHTDYGVLTILLADPVPGLQVAAPDGRWHDVTPVDDAVIVNIGDLTAQWTNDVWRSTLHRVMPATGEAGWPRMRRSVPFFQEANPDAVVECLPTCCSTDRPARYPATTAGDHLMAKLLGPRLQRFSETTSTLDGREALVRPGPSV